MLLFSFFKEKLLYLIEKAGKSLQSEKVVKQLDSFFVLLEVNF
jgi:hypothetical protein